MDNKFKKIDKEFVLSDSSVNCYGFRLMTDGYQLDQFQKNPIGYLMHNRDAGVLVRWEDLRIDGDQLKGKPVINMANPKAQQTIDEIENGFLNAASVGQLVVLKYTDDPALKLPNQSGPTVTQWYNRECSLVDIPGNYNALVLYDEHDNEINLADFTKPKISKMENKTFTPAMLAAMNLSDKSTDLEIAKSFNDLVAKAAKADKLEQDLKDQTAKANKDVVTAMLHTALTVDKKITKETSDKLAVKFENDPEGLKDLLASIPVHQSIVDKLKQGNGELDKDLVGKTFDELHQMGKLEEVKLKAPDVYKELYKAKFDKEPTV